MNASLVPHWINGAHDHGTSDRSAPVFDPALGKETKRVVLANAADIEKAVASAHSRQALKTWEV